MHTRWLAVLILVALVPGVAMADSLKIVGCPAWGYLFQVPTTWAKVTTADCPSAFYRTADKSTVIAGYAERHGYWTDARSNASIRGDAHLIGTVTIAWDWRAFSINHRRWYLGTTTVQASNGVLNVYAEGETYAYGMLYKFTLFTYAGASEALKATRLQLGGAIWATFRIFKV